MTTSLTPGSLVSNSSLRLPFRSSAGVMPASASSGSVSSSMRPLERAKISCLLMVLPVARSHLPAARSARDAPYPRAQQLELFFDALVAAIDVIDAIDQGL